MYYLPSDNDIRRVVWDVVHRTPVLDIHTHLFDPRFEDLCLWGIDELLTYHYLIAELFRYGVSIDGKVLTPADVYAMPKERQAELVWQRVFLDNSPISEAARGVLTSLGLLRIDPGQRSLTEIRKYFEGQSYINHANIVLSTANISAVVMTNDPFDDAERRIWEKGSDGEDTRFIAALRLDQLINTYELAVPKLRSWGYNVNADPNNIDQDSLSQVRKFLLYWIDKMKPWYMAVSLPPNFDAFDNSSRSKLLRRAILPIAQEQNIPLALMVGVNKLVNPELRLAGDSVGKSNHLVIERLCREYPNNKFLVTMLSRENQHELCITARKFRNMMLFGCWWFLNIPQEIEEITRMRLELLGLGFIPQHSDARVLDQLTYKWAHSRWIFGRVFADKYVDLARTGWRISEEEIERDIQSLFSGNFLQFCGK